MHQAIMFYSNHYALENQLNYFTGAFYAKCLNACCTLCADVFQGALSIPRSPKQHQNLGPMQYMLPIYMACPYAYDCMTLRMYNCCSCTSFLS